AGEVAALRHGVERLEVLVVAADEPQLPAQGGAAGGVVGELGGHGALGGLAPVVLSVDEGFHVSHREHQVRLVAQASLQRGEPLLDAVEAPVDVAHADDEPRAAPRHGPAFTPGVDPALHGFCTKSAATFLARDTGSARADRILSA